MHNKHERGWHSPTGCPRYVRPLYFRDGSFRFVVNHEWIEDMRWWKECCGVSRTQRVATTLLEKRVSQRQRRRELPEGEVERDVWLRHVPVGELREGSREYARWYERCGNKAGVLRRGRDTSVLVRRPYGGVGMCLRAALVSLPTMLEECPDMFGEAYESALSLVD